MFGFRPLASKALASGILQAIQAVVVAERTGAPAYKPKKRHVVNLDGNLLIFSSKQDALSYLNSQVDVKVSVKQENALASVKTAPTVIPSVKEQVSLSDIRKMAEDRQALQQFNNQLRRMQYDALIKAYEEWIDEDEIELLLMVA
jgi:hypothetical protein